MHYKRFKAHINILVVSFFFLFDILFDQLVYFFISVARFLDVCIPVFIYFIFPLKCVDILIYIYFIYAIRTCAS